MSNCRKCGRELDQEYARQLCNGDTCLYYEFFGPVSIRPIATDPCIVTDQQDGVVLRDDMMGDIL